jgi:hypothetical protein
LPIAGQKRDNLPESRVVIFPAVVVVTVVVTTAVLVVVTSAVGVAVAGTATSTQLAVLQVCVAEHWFPQTPQLVELEDNS